MSTQLVRRKHQYSTSAVPAPRQCNASTSWCQLTDRLDFQPLQNLPTSTVVPTSLGYPKEDESTLSRHVVDLCRRFNFTGLALKGALADFHPMFRQHLLGMCSTWSRHLVDMLSALAVVSRSPVSSFVCVCRFHTLAGPPPGCPTPKTTQCRA